MAIRLRWVDGYMVAICAARSVPKEGDVYLDDAAHHAIKIKFDLDHCRECDIPAWCANEPEVPLMEREESNNQNREWWDRTYGETNS